MGQSCLYIKYMLQLKWRCCTSLVQCTVNFMWLHINLSELFLSGVYTTMTELEENLSERIILGSRIESVIFEGKKIILLSLFLYGMQI